MKQEHRALETGRSASASRSPDGGSGGRRALLPWLDVRFGLGAPAGVLGGIAGALSPLHMSIGMCSGGLREEFAALAMSLLLVAFLKRWETRARSIRGPAAIGLGCIRHGHPPATACRRRLEGGNSLLLRYDGIGRSWFVFGSAGPETVASGNGALSNLPWNVDLALRWYRDPGRLPFDTRPQEKTPAGWYRLVGPPGLSGMTLPTRGNQDYSLHPGDERLHTAPGAASARGRIFNLMILLSCLLRAVLS